MTLRLNYDTIIVNIFPDFKMRDLRSYKTGDNFSGCLDKLACCRR